MKITQDLRNCHNILLVPYTHCLIINLATQMNAGLMDKLVDAIENNKPERTNAIAIILAKRLGYSDHRILIKDIRGENQPTAKKN